MTGFKYHAFVSHAIEDQIPFVTELCNKLETSGLDIWYSGKQLKPTDSLQKKIDEAIDGSRFGVVVFSPAYMSKQWTMAEFYRLWARDGKTKAPVVVIPIYHNITPEEVLSKLAILTDRFGVKASKGAECAANEVREFITKETIRARRRRNFAWAISILILSLIAMTALYVRQLRELSIPGQVEIEAMVNERIGLVEGKPVALALFGGGMPGKEVHRIDSAYRAFKKFKSYYRNEYMFTDGLDEVSARKNVNSILQLAAQNLSPENNYGMDSAEVSIIFSDRQEIVYRYRNRAPILKKIERIGEPGDAKILYQIRYQNNVRQIEVRLELPENSRGIKRHRMLITGLKPVEIYEVVNSPSGRKLSELKNHSRETE